MNTCTSTELELANRELAGRIERALTEFSARTGRIVSAVSWEAHEFKIPFFGTQAIEYKLETPKSFVLRSET